MAALVLPYTRRELPAWGRVMSLVGGDADELWAGAPLERVAYKWTNCSVRLNLADRHERIVYFCGRYYDLGTQLTLRRVLGPGDTFVDIGANIGLMTVLGGHLVGPQGRVFAFEPNPECYARLNQHVTDNGLSQVRVFPLGLSDRAETLSLTRDTDSSVHGSLSPPSDPSRVTSRHEVRVERGDDMLVDLPLRPMTIKIDVEGFECKVIQGLTDTIAKHRPTVLTEVVPEHLRRAGSSDDALFDLMHGLGYAGSAVTTVRRWTRYNLQLLPVSNARAIQPGVTDVVWTPRAPDAA
jgi:FkbM family methyltransferase